MVTTVDSPTKEDVRFTPIFAMATLFMKFWIFNRFIRHFAMIVLCLEKEKIVTTSEYDKNNINGEDGVLQVSSTNNKNEYSEKWVPIKGIQNGEIILDNKKVEGTNKDIGYMFQKDHLFEWRTIWQNVTLGLEITKSNTLENQKIIQKLQNIKNYMTLYYTIILFRT